MCPWSSFEKPFAFDINLPKILSYDVSIHCVCYSVKPFAFNIYLPRTGSCDIFYIVSVRFYPTALKDCQLIVFTPGVRMGWRAVRKSLFRMYLRNCKE